MYFSSVFDHLRIRYWNILKRLAGRISVHTAHAAYRAFSAFWWLGAHQVRSRDWTVSAIWVMEARLVSLSQSVRRAPTDVIPRHLIINQRRWRLLHRTHLFWLLSQSCSYHVNQVFLCSLSHMPQFELCPCTIPIDIRGPFNFNVSHQYPQREASQMLWKWTVVAFVTDEGKIFWHLRGT